jgi:hypothetical protein
LIDIEELKDVGSAAASEISLRVISLNYGENNRRFLKIIVMGMLYYNT